MNCVKGPLVAAVTASLSIAVLATTAKMGYGPAAIPQGVPKSGYPQGPPDGNQGVRLQGLRQAGLLKDRSRVQEAVAALQTISHRDFIPTALHTLVQLHAIEALPAIDSLKQRRPGSGGPYVTAARDRLVAEASTAGIPDPADRAAVTVDKFYEELGLSPSELTDDARRFHIQLDGPARWTDGDIDVPVGVYAMRELADMVYSGPYEAYATLPGVTRVDFSTDYASALKIRLAPLAQEQRLVWLVDDLAHKKVLLGGEAAYEKQLLADGGKEASRLVVTKLWEMDGRRDEYREAGFSALIDVLNATRDKGEKAIFAHLRRDKDGTIAQDAIHSFAQFQFAPGY